MRKQTLMSDTSSEKNGENLPSLPEKWIWTTLGEVSSDPQYGWTTKAVDNGSLHILRTTDITSGLIDWSRVPYCLDEPSEKDKYLLKDGDVVISRAGSVGFSYLVKSPPPAVFASYLIRFKPAINERYFSVFLKSPIYWKAISENSVGIALQNVNASKLRQISIPLGPLEEQSRIVDKIEELFTQLDAGVAGLEKVRSQLQRYRQAVLKAAFEGQFTQKWREQHQREQEPADVLIQNIREEQSRSTGKKLRDDPLVDDEATSPLPQFWCYATIAQTSEKIVDCPHSTPKYGVGNAFCVDTTCIEPGKLISERLRRVDANTFKERNKRLAPKSGDIVFAREGTIGTAVVLPESPAVCLGQRVMLIRPSNRMNNKYVCYAIMSPQIRDSYKLKIMGSTVSHINVGDVVRFRIPCAPRVEQDLIVSEIERRFSQIDHRENTIETSLRQAESLRQSILKQAFEGKLVPQSPIDEPASVLLERIRAEK